MELYHFIAASVAVVLSIGGVYIKMSNDLALATLRIAHLEKQAEKFDAQINAHDDKIQAILLDLKNDISDLKLLIEQRFNSQGGVTR
jgi:hypothetical protein